MSRLGLVREAVRPSLKARLMLSGPAGSGKTMTALEVATGLGERILMIDTERESALTYADSYSFDHLPWAAPYSPEELARTLYEAAGGYDVIVVDSLTHFWGGTGGTLDIADGKFGGWKVARPAQESLVQAILGADAHVIVCVRAKIEHVQEVDDRTGKITVKKLGMASMQDSTLEYEFNLVAEMDIEHRIAVSKSRTTAVPVGTTFQPGHARDLAVNYRAWLESGEPLVEPEVRALIEAEIAEFTSEQRAALGSEWRMAGLPKVPLLTQSQGGIARSLIAKVAFGDVGPDSAPQEPQEASEGLVVDAPVGDDAEPPKARSGPRSTKVEVQ